MKQQALNPFLPSFEYIPDGEPHVFGGRLYLYGSHDRFGGKKFCENDYVAWSASLDDLSNWRSEGEIYKRTQDSDNAAGKYELWAPDVVKGPDGRYYLYYCLADYPKVGVAVCDTPCGRYEFHGHVHDAAGTAFGTREGDFQPFDPAALVDDDGRILLYSGNGPVNVRDRVRKKASVYMELAPDMVTMKTEPSPLIPIVFHSAGTGFEGHEFFEAGSIRKFRGRYYFIYSSVACHELCYAVSDRPDGGFVYGGVLVSNGDIRPEDGVSTGFNGKADVRIRNYIGNNHGSIVEIDGKHYVFYHRHTNRRMYSRQACAEKIELLPDGRFLQAELTSCGLNGDPLRGEGTYEARIACHLFSKQGALFSALVQKKHHPAFTQDGADRESDSSQHIENMRDGATAVFRYFDMKSARGISVLTRGNGQGELVVRDDASGDVAARISVKPSKEWHSFKAPLQIADGLRALRFTYEGKGAIDLMSFSLK